MKTDPVMPTETLRLGRRINQVSAGITAFALLVLLGGAFCAVLINHRFNRLEASLSKAQSMGAVNKEDQAGELRTELESVLTQLKSAQDANTDLEVRLSALEQAVSTRRSAEEAGQSTAPEGNLAGKSAPDPSELPVEGAHEEWLLGLERLLSSDNEVAAVEEHLSMRPKGLRANPRVLRALASAMERLEQWSEAETLLVALTRGPDPSAIDFYNLGRVRHEQARDQEALGDFEQAVAQDTDLARAWYAIGVSKWNLGNGKGALEALDQAETRLEGKSLAQSRFLRCVIVAQQGDLKEAERLLVLALAGDAELMESVVLVPELEALLEGESSETGASP